MSNKQLIIREIDKLPEDALGEVLDFIQFVEIKREKERLARSSQTLSADSFRRIWDNKEDAVYDAVQ
ncbi:MAG: toxin-antitoxin system, antitoxin component, Xre family protein [Deltaproteobacteria bacterium]|nr:toxin-antitoxin system, antitoxin component, Xre family protein [Deltaproteobacteria bacterium]